ncbi:hypothetical protein JYU34_010999 [Plutella xylostella]|uniref:Zinc finger protein n=1 Tax=Plutella xylostella TaxID=51655 RepID=A0ABQ7QH33_PLUXY|nr:hypothetical protein JYU34_010999 [Plutella xylostella]
MEDSYIISNFHSLCRLCLTKSSLMVSIFGASPDDENNVAITSKITTLCDLQLNPNDGLPGRICYRCLFQLDNCSKFKMQCTQNESKLLEIANRNVEMDNCTSSEIMNSNNQLNNQTKPKSQDYVVEDSVVMVVDPSLDYDTSEESDNADHHTGPAGPTEKDNNIDGEVLVQENFKNIAMCQYCDQAFATQEKCTEHELGVHDPNLPFNCVECSLVFAERSHFVGKGDLQRHVLVHSAMKPYVCRKCPLSFCRRDKLIKHERKHGINPNPQSRQGAESTENNSDHNDIVININPFSNLMTLPHNSNTHGNYDLPQIPDHIMGQSSFNQEQNKMKPVMGKTQNSPTKLSPKNRPKNIKCHQCAKRFASLDAYKKHVSAAHIVSRLFQCKVCFKKFVRKHELDCHSAVHAEMKSFSCDKCEQTFMSRDQLVEHEAGHECLYMNMPCTECGATFEKKADLVAHIKSHFSDEFLDKSSETENKEDLIMLHDIVY